MLNPEDVIGIRRLVRAVHVAPAILDYALAITRATRAHADLELGASPRASIWLIRCAQARALIQAREYVVPDDVKALAVPALRHRVVPPAKLRLDRGAPERAIAGIVAATSVPVAQ